MKPNFALSLSAESIRLLHRATGGWRLVGEVSPEAPDLDPQLATLRATATALAPDGLRCKLVIPDAQIRYLSLETAALTTAERRDAARAALEGATPYPVEDLIFDVASDGNRTHVAAVALETLQEAEGFANEHRFHPVSFVARPAAAAFPGEPYFGPSRSARDLLAPGDTIEPDSLAIVILRDMEQPTGPVAEASAEAVATPLPPAATTFRSARPTEATTEHTLDTALASLRRETPKSPDIARPDLPQRDVGPQFTAFASRRPADAPETQAPDRTTHIPVAGFAEARKTFEARPPEQPRKAPPPAPATPRQAAQSEAVRMTVFGARGQPEEAPRSRGLPLGIAAVFVLGLTGLGTWSFGGLQDRMPDWFGSDRADPASVTAVDVAPPVDMRSTGQEPGLTDEDAAVLDALRVPAIEDADPLPIANDLRASYAVTGIWPLAPDVPSPPPLVDLEDLYVTSIDPIEPAFDAVALPQVASFGQDLIFDAPLSPAAAGTTFDLDPRGLVVPTAAGTLNPDGIAVFEGVPPARPGAFPSRDTSDAQATPVQTELAAFRPRARPAQLVENTERATLDGFTRSELAETRPPPRPAPPAVQGTRAGTASLVPLDGQRSLLVTQTPGRVVASNADLARAASQRPGARPGNFGQIVARAERTAASAAAVGAAAIAPRAVSPRIPSSASVAQEATLRNAINLRRVNLVGVYGTPSDRRALVRLSNGRYKKVEVGDRVDGGRVSAIGEGELRYQKGGRNFVLKMPQG